MPEVRNDKEFLDLHGLELFWNKVKDYLDVSAFTVPAGKQVASVRQDHGRLVVTFEAFGGATGAAKEAARESLGVSSSEEVEEALAGKTDKVSGATAGNFAGLDSNGNLVDSGVDPETLKRVQEAWSAEPDSALYTLGSIGQDANGVVSVTFVRIPDATDSSSGLMSSEDKGKLDGLPDEAELDGLLEDKADKVENPVPGNLAGLDSGGNLADSGYSVVDTASGEDFGDNIPTGGAVLEAIGDAVGELDSTGSGSSAHVTVTVVQTDGVITDVSVSDTAAAADHVHGNISNDGKVGSVSGKYLVTGENGVVEAGDLPVASTSAAGIVRLSNATDSDSESTAATSRAVQDAIAAASAEVAGLNFSNRLSAGKYITELSQTEGQISYAVDTMDDAPANGSMKPVVSNGLYPFSVFKDTVEPLIPRDASAQNQLADKAYVDAIGERLESRYLSSYSEELDEYIPFPTYADFVAAQSSGAFYYNGTRVSKVDNNDVIVITADEEHRNEAGGPSTTRYRYQCDLDTGANGHWYFEYVINNTALNLQQLMAINSGITSTKVGNYDAHLEDTSNPHQVTKDQVGLGNVDNTSDLAKPISTATQSALDEKLDKIQNTTSDDHDHIVVLGADGVSLADSGAVITSTYDDDDTVNPVTGSAITEALGGLDFAEVGGAGYYISKVKQEDGTITATATAMDAVPTAGSTNAITSGAVKQEVDTINISLGGKADKDADAVAGNIAEFDENGNPVDSGHALSEYKTKQGAITVNPESSTNSLTFLTSFEQNANGEITNASAATVPDASTSLKGVVQLTDSTSTTSSTLAATATAVKEAYDHADSLVESLYSTKTGTSTNVDVQVVEEAGLITGVSVTDRTPTAIANAIEALDATVRTDDSETGTAQSSNIDLTITQVDGVLTGITVNRDDSVNAGDLASAISTAVGTMDATVRTDNSETGTADNRNIDLTVTQVDGVLTGITVNRDETENRNNKVSSFQSTPDDTHYPSEKLVKDSLDLKSDKSGMAITAVADSTKKNIQLMPGLSQDVVVAHQDITGKADRVSGATDGNFAGLDSNGNLVDSGKSYADLAGTFKAKQSPVIDPVASGTAVSFIDTIEQDSNGEITVTKKTVPSASSTQSGLMSSSDWSKLDALPDASTLANDIAAKADKDADAVEGNLAVFDGHGNPVDSGAKITSIYDGSNSTDPVTGAAVSLAIADKADKVSSATNGNFAGLDANGNLTDSGSKASDFAISDHSHGNISNDGKIGSTAGLSVVTTTGGEVTTVDLTTTDVAASGTTLTAVTAVTQDSKGKISVEKKTIQDGTTAQKGVVQLSSAIDSDLETVAATSKAVKLAYKHADSVVSDLDAEVTSTDGTNVQVKVTQANGKIAGVSITTDDTENVNNKVSSFQAAPDDAHYPSEKLVKDSLDLKANKSEMTVTPGTGANADKTAIQLKTGTSATVLTAHQDITGKADKVSGATADNFASFDASGNIKDSGKKASDFKTKQTAKVSPTASGNTLSFIDTVSQDENGEITATKKTVTVDSTYSSAGTNPVNGQAVAAAIGTLDVNNISGFGAGKTLATLTETDGKIGATFQDIEITKSQVSDFPTEMTPSSHTHGNITNDGKIGTTADLGIVTGTGGTVTTKDFTQASPTTGSGTTTEFISTVAQGSDGAISATKKAITPASTSAAGIVQLSSSTSSSSETMAATPKAVSDLAASLGADKADKVSGATAGNFAGLDSNGNLTDSGKKASDFATSAQGSKADTAIQGVKVNGTELTKDSLNKVDITAVTGVKGSNESTYRTGQVSITAGNVGAYTTAEVDAALALKEDAANKKQTVNTSSTTEFPSSAAVAAFVNSSIATATANFLGNYTLTDLGLTYPATNTQIESALGSYTWPAGVTPTNNDYVLVSINSGTDPDTGEPIIDEYRRFKYNDRESSWAYEYTVNNSSFTSAQWSAINSGITAGDKSAYDDHLADTSNPHSVTAAQVGLGNVDNTADIDKPISTATQAALNDKVDKVYTATENHIAVFDNAGNIKDSGKTYSDMQGEFKPKQTAKSSPTVSGNTLSFIDTVSQDADGVITATKKSVTVDSTYSSSGTNPVNGTAIKAAIDGLDAAITSNDGANVQVKVTETDGKISAVNVTTDNTENRNNKVSSWQGTPDDTHYPTEKLVKDSLDGKVDKVEGKGLSTEDYTTAEKTKLAGIAAGAEVNQNAFSNVKVGSTTVAADSKTDTLEIAGGTGIDAVGDTTNDKVTLSLDSATQLSLGKADSAVQSVKVNGGSELKDASGNVNIPLAVATGSTGAKAGALSADDKKKLNELGTAAFKNVPTSGNAGNDEVVLGSDTRLSAGASAVQDVTVDGASVVNSSTKVAAVPNASTSAKGAVQLAGSIGATVASENNKAATEKAVRDAINALDSNKTSTDGINVQVKVTEADGKISAVNITTDNTENKNNKVSSWQGTPDDTHYPSEKLVKDELDKKADAVNSVSLADSIYRRINEEGDGWNKLAETTFTNTWTNSLAFFDVYYGQLGTATGFMTAKFNVRVDASGSSPMLKNFNIIKTSGFATHPLCLVVRGLVGNVTVELWGYLPKDNISMDVVFRASTDAKTAWKFAGYKNQWTFYNYSGTSTSKPVADAGNNIQVVDATEITLQKNIASPTNNNLVAMDASGLVKDSGKKATDFATAAQGSKADSAIQGVKVNNTTLTPDANKVVTVPLATTSADGAMSAADKAKLNNAVTKKIGFAYRGTSGSEVFKIAEKTYTNTASHSEQLVFHVAYSKHASNAATSELNVLLRVIKDGGSTVSVLKNTVFSIQGFSSLEWIFKAAIDDTNRKFTLYAVRTAGNYTTVEATCTEANSERNNLIDDVVVFENTAAELPETVFTETTVYAATSNASSGTAPVKVDAYGALTPVPMDSTPTASSTNLMTSGDIKTALNGKQDLLPTTGTPSDTYAINITGTARSFTKARASRSGSETAAYAKLFTIDAYNTTGSAAGIIISFVTRENADNNIGGFIRVKFAGTAAPKGYVTILGSNEIPSSNTQVKFGYALNSSSKWEIWAYMPTWCAISAQIISDYTSYTAYDYVTSANAPEGYDEFASGMMLSKRTVNGAVGSAGVPVYVNGNGIVDACTVDSSPATSSANLVSSGGVRALTDEIVRKAYGGTGYISYSAAMADIFAERTALGSWALNNKVHVRVQLYKFTAGNEANATLVWDSDTATGEVKEKFLNAKETGTLLTTAAGECVKIVYTGNTDTYLRALGVFMNVKVADASHRATGHLRIGNTDYPGYRIDTYGSLVTAINSSDYVPSATLIVVPDQPEGKIRIFGFRCLNSYTSGGTVIGTADAAQAYDATFTGTNSIKSALDSKSSATHTHGNINTDGTLQDTDVTIANGDKLVITDASDSNKVARASAAFDGSTITKALTQKGTFESVMMADDAMNLSAGNGIALTYSGSTATIAGNFTAGAGIDITYASNVATFAVNVGAIPTSVIDALA